MATKQEFSLDSLLETDPNIRNGRPRLRGTRITVHNVAAWHITGSTVDDMSKITELDRSFFHAALAYYFANRAKIDAEMDGDDAEEDALRSQFPKGITAESYRPS